MVRLIRAASVVLLAVLASWIAVFGVAGILYVMILVLLLLIVGSSILLQYMIVRKGGMYGKVGTFSKPSEEEKAQLVDYVNQKKRILQAHGCKRASLKVKGGSRLNAFYIPGEEGERRTVILFHGYGESGLQMTEYGIYYRERFGVNVLLPDARAHGESGGKLTGLGWLDRTDCLEWINWVIQLHGENAQIGLHGYAMGGSEILLAAGEGFPKQVAWMAVDGAYMDLFPVCEKRLKKTFGLPMKFLVSLAGILCGLKAGYIWQKVSVKRTVSSLRLPILYITGTEDEWNTGEEVKQFFDEIPSKEKVLLTLPGNRSKCSLDGPTDEIAHELEKMIDQFFERKTI